MGCAGLRGSEITLYGEISTPPMEKSCERPQLRNKVKTNGHFTTFMQVKCKKNACGFYVGLYLLFVLKMLAFLPPTSSHTLSNNSRSIITDIFQDTIITNYTASEQAPATLSVHNVLIRLLSGTELTCFS